MDEFWLIVLTFFVSIGTSIVSSFVGGGGGLILTPYLLLIGVPPVQTIATIKIGGLSLAVATLRKFKGTGQLRKDILPGLLAIAAIAAAVGPFITFSIDESLIPKIIAVILLAAGSALLIKGEMGLKQIETSHVRHKLGYVLAGFVALVQAAFGGGSGTLLLFVVMGMFGTTAIQANATKRAAQAPMILISAAIFALSGAVQWGFAGAIVLGNLIGGTLGASLALEKGNKIVLRALVAVVFLLSLRIFFL